MSNYTCLILTHVDKKNGEILTPHLNFFIENNQDVDVFVVVGEDSSRGKRYNWRNADQSLRKWWLSNGFRVKTKYVAVIEWDTLVNKSLPDIPREFDLVGKWVLKEPKHLNGVFFPKRMCDPEWNQDHWYWWPEIKRLGLGETQTAYGLVSFGCLLMRRWVLDSICDQRWDDVYKKDIVSELRFPSVAAAQGARIGIIALPYVHHSTMEYTNEQEIYHPIKKQFSH